MSKAVRLSVSSPISTLSDKSDRRQAHSNRVLPITSGKADTRNDARTFDAARLIPIALFSGIGLLILLVALLFGMQGAWY